MARLTNGAFAEAVGVSDSYASYLRSGKRLPSTDVFIRIVLTYELDPLKAMTTFQDGCEAFGAFLRTHVFMTEDAPKEMEPERVSG